MSDARDEQLHDQVKRLLDGDPAAAADLVEAAWDEISRRSASAYDAETCRLAMLAALDPRVRPATPAAVWRARALARYALVGWTEGVGAILMTLALERLARANDDYRDGRGLDRLRGSDEALAIIDELEPFTHEPGSGVGAELGPRAPSPALLQRFWWEKRGALLVVAGRWGEARESYAQAAVAAEGSERGRLKVRAGRALVDYLEARAAGSDGASAADATAALASEADAAGYPDVACTAKRNARAMQAGRGDLELYEIL